MTSGIPNGTPNGVQSRHSHPLSIASRELKRDKDMFRLILNVVHFRIDEIQVKHNHKVLVVRAVHEEKQDCHGFVSREFNRQFDIPEGIDCTTLECVYMENGILEIKAAKIITSPPEHQNREYAQMLMQKPVGIESMEAASFQ